MSHFVVYVILPKAPTSLEEAQETISKLIDRYDESKSVPGYDAPCSCREWALNRVGYAAADAAGLTYDSLRTSYDAREDVQALRKESNAIVQIIHGTKRGDYNDGRSLTDEEDAAYHEIEGKLQTLWTEHLAPRKQVEAEAVKAVEATTTFDPNCDECAGKGTYVSTYNPDSKWDWWVIGGRWTGLFKPAAEVEAKMGGRSHYGSPLGIWGNVASTEEALQLGGEPYAIVTPEGEWVGRGRMGWFGMSSGDVSQAEWKAACAQAMANYPGMCVVNVDCHI